MGKLKAKGTFKETVGRVTGNRKLQVEGKVDKGKGKVKEVVRKTTNRVNDLDRQRKLDRGRDL